MNIRLTILLVIILALVGGSATYYWVNQPDDKKHVDRKWLYRVNDSDLIKIEVIHKTFDVTFSKAPGGNAWFIGGDPPVQVHGPKWSGTPFLLGGPAVERELPKAKEPLSSYGLDPPESVVRVTERGGYTFEFSMGTTTPDGTFQYIKLANEESIFTVAQEWAFVINKLAIEPPYPPTTP